MRKWIAAAAAIACFTSPALAVDFSTTLAKEGAVMIGSACAELWASKTYKEMMTSFDTIQDEFGLYAQKFDEGLKKAWDEYEAAKQAYAQAYDAETKSLSSAVEAGGKLLLQSLEVEADKPEGAFDAVVDYAVGTGTTIKDAGQLTAAIGADTQSALAKAEKAAKDKRIAYLKAREESNVYYDLMMPVIGCGYDQKNYLESVGEYEDESAPRDMPAPLLTELKPAIGGEPSYRIGFEDTPDEHGDIPRPEEMREGTLQWPEECQKRCMTNSKCIAWNYVQVGEANPGPNPMCEIYTTDNVVKFTGKVMRNASYISGYGPAAAIQGFAVGGQ